MSYQIINRTVALCALIFALAIAGCKKESKNPKPESPKQYDFSYSYIDNSMYASHVVYYQFSFTSNITDSSTFAWDFGDGATSTEPAPKHLYKAKATYHVTLTVNGDKQNSITKDLNISWSLPVNISWQGLQLPGNIISFHSTSRPDSSFLWNFGDGTSSTDSAPAHTFQTAGNYKVSLTINHNTAPSVVKTIPIYNDPYYTSQIQGMRLWHHDLEIIKSSGTTMTPQPDETFSTGYISPLQITFKNTVLYYGSYGSSDSILSFSYSYEDQPGYTHSTRLLYYRNFDSISVEEYDRVSAGGALRQLWHTY